RRLLSKHPLIKHLLVTLIVGNLLVSPLVMAQSMSQLQGLGMTPQQLEMFGNLSPQQQQELINQALEGGSLTNQSPVSQPVTVTPRETRQTATPTTEDNQTSGQERQAPEPVRSAEWNRIFQKAWVLSRL